ncbi:type II secretion system protein [Vibrio hannami]|uniref:type II secretion system protein n=1 Tax=Vibrio hannami TaxID=2717094 RepID=UPI00240F31BE|nr:type II secretion system protein [Vibrio hannami]MDG3084792.1 type II secretion system protein [Vibrio hannami]
MRRQGGFTLIELVVVIVILGILAVTAAPRFLNLQSDAREASLQGLVGAMQGAAGIVYGKAAIDGVETDSVTANKSAGGVTTHYGYPTSDEDGIVAAVTGLDDTDQWVAYSDDADADDTAGTLVATFAADDLDDADDVIATNCYVTYTAAEGTDAGEEATASVTETSGC